MRISEIRDILEASVLCGDEYLDRIIVGGGGADMMEAVLAAVAKGAVLLTGLTTEQVLRTAKLAEVGIIFCSFSEADRQACRGRGHRVCSGEKAGGIRNRFGANL